MTTLEAPVFFNHSNIAELLLATYKGANSFIPNFPNGLSFLRLLIAYSFSAFKELGHIHKYDADQLLNSSQTATLVETLLELNIYNLFFKKNIALSKWLGEIIKIEFEPSREDISPKSMLRIVMLYWNMYISCKYKFKYFKLFSNIPSALKRRTTIYLDLKDKVYCFLKYTQVIVRL